MIRVDVASIVFGCFHLLLAYAGYLLSRYITADEVLQSAETQKQVPSHSETEELLLSSPCVHEALNDTNSTHQDASIDELESEDEDDNAQELSANKIEDSDDDDIESKKKAEWGATVRKKWGSPSTMEQKRNLIMDEIVDTEKRYVESLHQLDKLFMTPMKASVGQRSLGVTQSDIDGLAFTSIDMILRLHESLLSQLEVTDSIGGVFIKFGDFLKMYTTFVNGYDNVLSTLSSLRKSKKYQSFTQAVRTKNPAATIESLLIMPVQRVPRYLLLLTELQKHTPEFHSDRPHLDDAVQRLHKIASHINESRSRFENSNQILSLQNRIQGYCNTLVLPTRRLLHEGRLRTKSSVIFAQPKNKVGILFNDSLMVVSRGYKFRNLIELEGASVDETDTEEPDLGFTVVDSEGKRSRFLAVDSATKQQWCGCIKEAIHLI